MSRTDARSTKLRRRPSRVIPATVVSVLLIAVGAGLVWATVIRLTSGTWSAYLAPFTRWASALTWGASITIVISLAAVVVGLIVLVTAWKPGRPSAMVLQPAHETEQAGSTEFVITRRAVAKLATAHADQVDGVDSVSAVVGARRVRLSVKSASEQRSELQATVTDRVRDALHSAGLHPLPTVTTTVSTQRL